MSALRPFILVLHGPNLNALGSREPAIYGADTLLSIDASLRARAATLGCDVLCVQSASEAVLVDAVLDAGRWADGVVINPGALTHTSVALRDAVLAAGVPVVECHLSHTDRREAFRRRSWLGPACVGRVQGFGATSYLLALEGLVAHLARAHQGGR